MGVDAQPTMPRNQQFREDLENRMNRDLRPEKYSQEEEKAVAPSSLNTSPPPPQRSLAAMKASLHEVDDLLQNIMYDAGCDEKDIRRTGLSRNPNSPLTDRPAGVDSPGIVHIDQPTPQADTPDFRLTLDGRILRRGDPGFDEPSEMCGAQSLSGSPSPAAAAPQGSVQNVSDQSSAGSTPTPAMQPVRNVYETPLGGAGSHLSTPASASAPFDAVPSGMMSPMSPAAPYDQALAKALSHAAMATAELRCAVERCNGGQRTNVYAVNEIQGEIQAAAELLAKLS